MADVYANANEAAAKHVETRRAVKRERSKVKAKAVTNLANTEHTPRLAKHKDPDDAYFPAYIDSADGDTDYYVVLHAPNAMALEFGHAPSGIFDPDKPGVGLTKPPAAEYILTRAAYGGSTIG